MYLKEPKILKNSTIYGMLIARIGLEFETDTLTRISDELFYIPTEEELTESPIEWEDNMELPDVKYMGEKPIESASNSTQLIKYILHGKYEEKYKAFLFKSYPKAMRDIFEIEDVIKAKIFFRRALQNYGAIYYDTVKLSMESSAKMAEFRYNNKGTLIWVSGRYSIVVEDLLKKLFGDNLMLNDNNRLIAMTDGWSLISPDFKIEDGILP